jgi:D-aminopeptidase
MATAAHDGYARALVPSHTPLDGDLIFAVSTDAKDHLSDVEDLMWLGHFAAHCTARAIARAIYAASPAEKDPLPSWSDKFR